MALIHSGSTLLRIFAKAAIPKVELGTVCRTISRIRLWRQVGQITVAGRSVRPTEISGQFLSRRSRLHRCWLRIWQLGCPSRRCCPTRCTLICTSASAVTLVWVAENECTSILNEALPDWGLVFGCPIIASLTWQSAKLALTYFVRTVAIDDIMHAQGRLGQRWPLLIHYAARKLIIVI